jgi:hypothetical protein
MEVLINTQHFGLIASVIAFFGMQVLMTLQFVRLFFTKTEPYSPIYIYVLSFLVYFALSFALDQEVRFWFWLPTAVAPAVAILLDRKLKR